MTASGSFPSPLGVYVQPGAVLRGKYRVERVIGQGGMAYVVAAWHVDLEQRVAIKLLRPETAPDPEAVERFLREARAASRLTDDHIARVIDVDRLESGAPFIVMEYLDGADLAATLRERGPLPPHEVAGWMREACSAIAEAHRLGIIHRDLKPANLFLTRKRSGAPTVKVLDFGISKLRDETRLTKSETGMGSAEYMSPEQMQSAADVDARSDVWSLGVTMYELLTGKTPFQADSVGQVAIALVTRDPAPPRTLRPDLPVGFESVILRCLEKEPGRRYRSVDELASALAPFVRALPVTRDGSSPAAEPRAQAIPATLVSAVATASPWIAGLPPPAEPEPGPAPLVTAEPAKSPESPEAAQWMKIGAGIAVGVLALTLILVAFAVGRRRPRSDASAPEGRFVLGATTVQDLDTKLTWQRTPAPGAMDWSSAKAYCARQGSGYRLPDLEELVTLYPITATHPPLDPLGFPTSPVDVFWSASPAGAGSMAVLHFSTGRQSTSVISARNRVRCVRP